MAEEEKCWAVTRSVNHSDGEIVLACGWKCGCAGPKLGRGSLFGEYGHAGESGLQWAGMFEGMCCQSFHQSQEHGKANTELISKTSKEGRFLPKKCSHLSFCLSASLPRSPSCPTQDFFPLIGHSNPFPFILANFSFSLWDGRSYGAARLPLLFWLLPGVKALGIITIGPV